MPTSIWSPNVDVATTHGILQEKNLILRNLKISQCYHELSEDLRRLLGSESVNWCTFAAWASRTAGYSIRNEILPAKLNRLLVLSPEYRRAARALNRHLNGIPYKSRVRANKLERYLSETLIKVSDEVSLGNQIVFEELAGLFAEFVHRFRHATVFCEQDILDFIEPLKPGPPEDGGQEPLKRAFQAFYRAIFEKGKSQAELILLGNLLTGLDEQVRLQGPIQRSLDAPLASSSKAPPAKDSSKLNALLGKTRKGRSRLHQEIKESVAHAWRVTATELFMSYRGPENDQRLGRDLETGPDMFPETLREINLPELRGLLERWDRTLNTTKGSAACDWSDLGDRMNYVADLFRSKQASRELFQPPYREEQVQDLKNNRIPKGPL